MKTKATPAVENILPVGADDPASWFYIPAEKRNAWLEWAKDAPMKDLSTALSQTAFLLAFESLGDQYPTKPRPAVQPFAAPSTWKHPDMLSTRGYQAAASTADVLRADFDAVREAAQFAVRAAWVQTKLEAAEVNRAGEARARTTGTCAVCGEFDQHYWNLPRPHTLEPTPAHIQVTFESRTRLHCCTKCSEVARAEWFNRIATPDRVAAVRAAIAAASGEER